MYHIVTLSVTTYCSYFANHRSLYAVQTCSLRALEHRHRAPGGFTVCVGRTLSSDCWQKVSHILLPSRLCLQHEKYTSQLQLSFKALEARAKAKQQQHSSDKSKDSASAVKLLDRAERRAHSLTGTLHPRRRDSAHINRSPADGTFTRNREWSNCSFPVSTEVDLNALFTRMEEEVFGSSRAADIVCISDDDADRASFIKIAT